MGTDPYDLAVEGGGTVLVSDRNGAGGGGDGPGALYRVDAASGVRTLVSDFGNAFQGSPARDIVSLALEAGSTVLVIDQGDATGVRGLLFRVDRLSGQRAVVSDFRNTGQGVLGVQPSGVAVSDDRVIDPTDIGPPPAPDAVTEPLVLSNPRPSGCTFSDGVITCAETAGTPSSIVFDTNIPGDARFVQFEFSFEGADGQALATESRDAPGTSADDPRQRINAGDLGVVFISNVPIAALPGSSAPPGGGFRSSGQFRLRTSGATTATVTNFPSGALGSVFRIRNLRIDRCTKKCLRKSPTICGTNGPDRLIGMPGSDVIDGRGGDDRIEGKGGNDRICGGTGNDRLLGGKGNDRLSGGEGKDRLVGGAGRDKLDGGLGRDTCDDGSGEDSARRCDKK